MTDIVDRLKSEQVVARARGDKECDDVCGEAADEIERLRGVEQDAAEWVEERTKRLRSDNERLRAALLQIANSVHGSFDDSHVMADIARRAGGER